MRLGAGSDLFCYSWRCRRGSFHGLIGVAAALLLSDLCPDITNRCKKLNSSVCQDVKLIAGGLVDSIYPEIENLGNFTQFRSLVKNQEIGRTCLEHLQRILCVEAYPLCHRQAPDQCGDVRRVCKSYCENFKAVCPLPQKVRDIITEKWRDFDSLMDCDMFDHEPRDINDRCIHQPIILGEYFERVILQSVWLCFGYFHRI